MVDPPRPGWPPVDRWLLPGELARAVELPDGAFAAAGPAPRTPRDWVVDTALFLAAVSLGITEFETVVAPNVYGLPLWWRVVDVVVGAAVCLSLWWRRRFPVAMAVGGLVAGVVSTTAGYAVVALLFSVALHAGWKWAVPLAGIAMLTGVPAIFVLGAPPGEDPVLIAVIVVLMMLVAVIAGLGVRARRQLVLVLRLRAAEARREEERRQEESRRAERERIAREMHDVLAHRISLLSVHAGALEYRTAMADRGGAPPLTAAEVHEAVGVVRSNAHQALEELRDVLQVLHDPDVAEGVLPSDGRRPPQPTTDRLTALLEEARRSGQQVEADLGGDLTTLRPQLQRTVYRLVQEGLTNARKHAPGAAVQVLVGGGPGAEVVVEITNRARTEAASGAVPGAGVGLTGLAERVALDGGRLTRQVEDGVFRLSARIPWPA